jgi:hypothetical protein
MSQTSAQFDQAIASCSDIFIKKTKDYSLKPLEVHVLFYLIEFL